MWTGIELLLVFLGVVLFGSALLALLMGYSKLELERLERNQAQGDFEAARLAAQAPAEGVVSSVEDSNPDDVVIYLNEYLRQAQASAERFVARPSVEKLQMEAHQKRLWH